MNFLALRKRKVDLCGLQLYLVSTITKMKMENLSSNILLNKQMNYRLVLDDEHLVKGNRVKIDWKCIYPLLDKFCKVQMHRFSSKKIWKMVIAKFQCID